MIDLNKIIDKEQKTDWRFEQLPQEAKDKLYDYFDVYLCPLQKWQEETIAFFKNAPKFNMGNFDEKAHKSLIENVKDSCYYEQFEKLVELFDWFNKYFELTANKYIFREFIQKNQNFISKKQFLEIYYKIAEISNINTAGYERKKELLKGYFFKYGNTSYEVINNRIKIEGLFWGYEYSVSYLNDEEKNKVYNFIKLLVWYCHDSFIDIKTNEVFKNVIGPKNILYTDKVEFVPNEKGITHIKLYKNQCGVIYFEDETSLNNLLNFIK